jgi:hypothetical protein
MDQKDVHVQNSDCGMAEIERLARDGDGQGMDIKHT